MNTPKFIKYTSSVNKKSYRCKFLTKKLLEENGNCISNTVRVRYGGENRIYVNCYLTYMHNIIYSGKNKQYKRKTIMNKESLSAKNKKVINIEDKIREIMKENNSISVKKIAELTGYSIYPIYRYYMKVRRENSK